MTAAQRENLETALLELMVLGEITTFIGQVGAETGKSEGPASWLRWIGGQTERVAYLARFGVRRNFGEPPVLTP